MNKKLKIILVILLVILFLSGGIFGVLYYNKLNKVVSIVTIDINPSLSLSLNYKGKVVKVEGINEDGKKLLENNNLKGSSLENAIESISDLAIDNGYLSNEKNHILINIEGEDVKEDVSKILTNEIKEKNINCEVIYQELSDSSKENASKYGISENKATYIEEVIKENKEVKFEDLKDKSINEINKYIEEKKEQERLEQEKKEEEAKKEEENKKPTTNSGTTNNSSGSKPSNSGGTGTVAVCSKAKFNLENDDATKKVFSYLGLDFSMKLWYNHQTVAKAYNGICTYETMLVHNKKMYKYYHNVTDGSIVHKENFSFLAGTHQDAVEIAVNYFVTKYGATKEEVTTLYGGGTVNDVNRDITVKYKDVKYTFIIEQKTGKIKSVKEGQ